MPTDQTVDFVVMFLTIGLLVLGLGSVLLGWLMRMWDSHVVNRSQTGDVDVMSRTQDEAPRETLSSHRQTDLQTDRQTAQVELPLLSRDIMLDIYRLLREYNVPREKARPILKSAGIPLDNNLWTQAAPPDEKVVLTPIAGRPTKAHYYDDPDLDYRAPPE